MNIPVDLYWAAALGVAVAVFAAAYASVAVVRTVQIGIKRGRCFAGHQWGDWSSWSESYRYPGIWQREKHCRRCPTRHIVTRASEVAPWDDHWLEDQAVRESNTESEL